MPLPKQNISEGAKNKKWSKMNVDAIRNGLK